MDKLKRSRGTIRARTTRILNKLYELLDQDEVDNDAIEQLITQLDAKSTTLNELNESIMNLIPEDNGDEIEEEANSSEEINETIIAVKTRAMRKINGRANSVVAEARNCSITEQRGANIEVKLPRLTIQPFSGEATQWQSFWGQFKSTIHDNAKLADIDKFNYLRSYLQGAAAKAVGGFVLTNENYHKAINTLTNRFGKKTVAMQSHMHKLTSLAPIKRSSDVHGLRELYDNCDTQMKSLDSLGIPLDSYSSMLYSILMKVLPSDIYLEFSKKLENDDEWDISDLLEHLRMEVESRERAALCKPEDHGDDRRPEIQPFRSKINLAINDSKFTRRPHTTAALSTAVAYLCLYCKEAGHTPERCEASTMEQRLDAIKTQNRCFICLKVGHRARRCRSSSRCTVCEKRHHTSICRNEQEEQRNTKEKTTESTTPKALTSMTTVLPPGSSAYEQVLLQTVLLYVEDQDNQVLARCLLDNGAQQSFIREVISRSLQLPVIAKHSVVVNSFGSKEGVLRDQRRVKVTVRSIIEPEKSVELEVLEIPTICGALVSVPGDRIIQEMKSKGITLTDRPTVKGVAAPSELGILIGADHYWSVVQGNTMRLGGSLAAVESLFGWSIQGPVPVSINLAVRSSAVMVSIVEDQSLSAWLPKFWELESLGIQEEKSLCISDQDMIDRHSSTIQFKNDRYEVQLPWRSNHPEIKNNLSNATRRMKSLICRFWKDRTLYQQYADIIDEYLRQGIAEPVPMEEKKNEETYYIPHFGVTREDKLTTKLRIVFDASSHEKSTSSLNACLESGPNLNPDLLVILIQFRRHRVALMADVEKAFLQISLAPEDRNYVRFLWIRRLPEVDKPVQFIHLRMARVLFGVTTSPFLLTATLKYHFKTLQEQYPETCDILNKNLYVDDLLTGAKTTSDANRIRQDSQIIMKAASMNLRKWVTNSKELTQQWQLEEDDSPHGNDSQTLKVLGVTWSPCNDTFTFDVSTLLDLLLDRKDTKRGVLQAAARVFDPIGFISPFLINVKCLFQKLWVLGIGWDEQLPKELQDEWDQWCLELNMVPKITIPRFYYHPEEEEPVAQEIHLFCDASTKAYGAVTYLRYENHSGEIRVALIASKTRVAPLKKLTLPRLELMAALIGARLLKYTLAALENKISNYRCWSVSEIVLHWIRGSSKDWKPFVGNRISEIQSLTDPLRWAHCSSKDNPADLPSRGCKAQELVENRIWWHGPTWLTKKDELWPKNKFPMAEQQAEILNEKRAAAQLACMIRIAEPLLDLQKFHSASKVFRITAWVLRYIKNSRSPKMERDKGPLTSDEIHRAKLRWVKQVQEESFSEEISLLRRGCPLPSSSKLAPFNPFLDEGIVRMGGRLQFSNLDYRSKHPCILSSKQRLSELLVIDCHWKMMHGGLNSTITQLREEYWVIKGRQLVKRLVERCRLCKRFQAKPGVQVMAPLPSDRITESPPFNITGVDFAGPLYIRETNQPKVYIALFTCGVTRAVHLEIVTDLSADKFLLAFRRFLSRRGVCSTIYSDNARTFKRSDKDIKQLYRAVKETKVQEYVGERGIRWVYIVERAAWWGGFWERLVRTVKTCLRRTLGRISLNYEELCTTMTEIEAVINSRPLTHVFTEAGEPEALSPAHFLLGRRLTSLPDRNFQADPVTTNRDQITRRLKYRQTLLNQFWKRWTNNYLMELRSAHSSSPVSKVTAFKPDDVVLIGDQNLPRQSWRMGRIVETYPGRDNLIRSCSIRLPDGTVLRRAVQMIYNLEVSQ